MDELNRLTTEEFKEEKKTPLVLVLDNVRSLNNVGSAFRTADAFRIEKIFLCGITGTPPHKDIHKTALGATDSVVWEYVDSSIEAIINLKNEDYIICALEQADKSIKLHEFSPNPELKYALVFGNEVFGVEDEVIQVSHHVIEIPQFGTKHSLNISVTIGIALWDFLVKMDLLKKS
jgi:tRNA G18 (ribose-2'-O)-methylase SpoU